MNIFIFGASCSGKSTLSAALHETLGSDWTYLDRDDLIDKEGFKEEAVDTEIERRITEKSYCIIDAQTPWRERKEGELYFRISPPLDVLLHRDALRTKQLKRTQIKAKWAREFVIETHTNLAKFGDNYFDCSFDSSSKTVEEEISQISKMLFDK
ncbi:MAG: hypothetical protein H7A41_02870 [Chlamydiales bacterium]|nr:hypothetical protein [Chlamydiales bacterium]